MPVIAQPLAMPTITLLFAAAAALINLWLAFRVVQLRFATKTMIGHGDANGRLYARARAQANFLEYVPIALLLMALIEVRAGHATGLWVIGAVLMIGRLLHPFGMDRPGKNPWRLIGILATWLTTLALALWALYLVFQPAGTVTYF